MNTRAAYIRLALRALLAGVAAAATQLSQPGTALAWKSALVAAVFASAEIFTPLNSVVGFDKKGSPSP